MSTRGAIVRPLGDGFSGVYHHWDSYPSGLGKALWGVYFRSFCRVDIMTKTLVDDHPAGWSTICEKDWGLDPGFIEYGSSTKGTPEEHRPQCYCHGERSEETTQVNEGNAADMGCEYVYVITPEAMVILSSYSGESKMIGAFGSGDPNAVWKPIAVVRWDEPEPDWENFEGSDDS